MGSNQKVLSFTELGTHKYFKNDSSNLDSLTSDNSNICAGFESGIVSGGNIIATSASVFSDERIKMDFTKPEKNWLDKLEKLEPYEYNLIEDKDYNYDKILGYKAQDVKQILGDNFINYTSKAIPNIFKNLKWTVVDDILLFEKEDFIINIDDMIKLQIIDMENIVYNETIKVINVSLNDFYVIKPDINIKSIFVYGIIVNDFHTIQINKMSYLNTYCIRELIIENKTLKEKLSNIENRLAKLEPF